jgi:cyanate permease
LYAFSLFLPTIVQGMGYRGTQAQLLTVPPYICAAVVTICVGFFADHTRYRGYCNLATVTVGMIGFILLLSSSNIRIQYAGTFLGAAGIYPTVRDRTNPPGRRVREILLT